MKINKYKILFGSVIAFFILCERCQYMFDTLDKLHIKHFLLMFILVICGISFFYNKNKIKKLEVKYETKVICITGIILYFISILFQLINWSFKIYSLEELYYFIAPVLFVFFIFNIGKDKDMDFYMDIVLYTGLFSFFSTRIFEGTLSISNFTQLFNLKNLFIDSISALNESDLSVYFMILTIYYAFKEKKFKMFLAAFGTFIGYKRIAVLMLFVFLALYYLKVLRKNKKVNNIIFYCAVIIFIIAPFSVYFMCTDSFANYFYQKFGIDFNLFTMTRFDIINTVIDAKLTNYGLGTVTDFLEVRGIQGQVNMHNDILRIYMECTIIGTIVFTYNFFKITKNNYFSFFIMLFIFLELFGAHFLGPGTVSFWIVAYIAIFELNREIAKNNKLKMEKENTKRKEPIVYLMNS